MAVFALNMSHIVGYIEMSALMFEKILPSFECFRTFRAGQISFVRMTQLKKVLNGRLVGSNAVPD